MRANMKVKEKKFFANAKAKDLSTESE